MAAGGRTKRLHVRAPRRRGAPRPAEGPHLGSVYRGAAWQNGWRGDGWRPRGPSQGPQRASRTARRHRSAPVARRRRAQTGDGAALQRRAREGDGGRRCDGIRALGRGRSVCGSASVRVQNARGGPFFRGPPLAVGMRWTWPYGNPRPERGRTVGHDWLPVVRLGSRSVSATLLISETLIRPLGVPPPAQGPAGLSQQGRGAAHTAPRPYGICASRRYQPESRSVRRAPLSEKDPAYERVRS